MALTTTGWFDLDELWYDKGWTDPGNAVDGDSGTYAEWYQSAQGYSQFMGARADSTAGIGYTIPAGKHIVGVQFRIRASTTSPTRMNTAYIYGYVGDYNLRDSSLSAGISDGADIPNDNSPTWYELLWIESGGLDVDQAVMDAGAFRLQWQFGFTWIGGCRMRVYQVQVRFRVADEKVYDWYVRVRDDNSFAKRIDGSTEWSRTLGYSTAAMTPTGGLLWGGTDGHLEYITQGGYSWRGFDNDHSAYVTSICSGGYAPSVDDFIDFFFLSASEDGTVKKTFNPTEIVDFTFTGHTGVVNWVSWDHSTDCTFTAGADGTVRMLNGDGVQQWSFSCTGAAVCVEADGAGNVFVADGAGFIRKIDSAGDEVWSAPLTGAKFVCAHYNGVCYAAGANKIQRYTSGGLAGWSTTRSGNILYMHGWCRGSVLMGWDTPSTTTNMQFLDELGDVVADYTESRSQTELGHPLYPGPYGSGFWPAPDGPPPPTLIARSADVAATVAIQRYIPADGDLAAGGAEVAGAAKTIRNASGAIQAAPVLLDGVGAPFVPQQGAIEAQGATVEGQARLTYTFYVDSDLAADRAVIDGSATRVSQITNAGPSARAASMDGEGDVIVTVVRTGEGALQGREAAVSGVAERVIPGVGTLQMARPTMAGQATWFIAAQGALSALVASTSGDAEVVRRAGTATLGAGEAEVSMAFRVSRGGAGALAADSAVVSGEGRAGIVVLGALSASPVYVGGEGTLTKAFDVELSAGPAVIESLGEVTTYGAGGLLAGSATVAGVGLPYKVAEGVLLAGDAEVDASVNAGKVGGGDLVAESADVGIDYTRVIKVEVALQAEPAAMYMVSWTKMDQDPYVWEEQTTLDDGWTQQDTPPDEWI